MKSPYFNVNNNQRSRKLIRVGNIKFIETMSVQKKLNENWSDYDNKKIRDKRDSRYFDCEEAWEKEYLLNQIKKHLPSRANSQIVNAIESCCKTVAAPRPRKIFVECVVSKL